MRPILTLLLIPLLTPLALAEPTPSASQIEFFEKKIRPVLAQNCAKCHSQSLGTTKGKLALDSRQALLKGGAGGPAIISGNAAQSSLIKAIQWTDKDLQMPPKQKLDPAAINDLVQWVNMGAPWPASVAKSSATAPNYAAEYDRIRKELWSWQPIANPPVPSPRTTGWAQNDIDRFILARLEAHRLAPSRPAEKLALLRRATFDLTGLAPTTEEIDAFLRDTSVTAFEKVVDRLLASPRFGERWGRHWLDVARYAESSGLTRNYVYPYAWRYRDYVIEAFTQDKPLNRFITEQIAGDLLPAAIPAQKDKNTIATGFLCVGTRDYNERNPRQFAYNAADEMIDTVGRAFLATTIACARCHDHKFDAIPTADYYAIAGIFISSDEHTGLEKRRGPNFNLRSDDELLPLSGYRPAPRGKRAQTDEEVRAEARSAFQRLFLSGANYTQPRTPIKSLAMGLKDDSRTGDVRILVRGELDHPGDSVKRGFLSIPCIKDPPRISSGTSGRFELAQWITHRDNPLAARVAVNRVWQHLFGFGIVRSVDNFGATGDKPTHPELLDFLASRFVQDGWSTKKAIKNIMMSAAYQQSAAFDKPRYEADPDNHLLWRQNQRRLEAEAIRDAMLQAGGKINYTAPIASLAMDLPPVPLGSGGGRFNPSEIIAGTNYRSVYLPVFRNLLPEVLDVFDFADNSNVTGQRDVTTVPPQALYMLNSAFVLRQSREMANRLLAMRTTSDLTRVDQAYKLALGRPATAAERDRAIGYLNQFLRDPKAATAKDPLKNRTDAWASFCQALFACAEFRYLN